MEFTDIYFVVIIPSIFFIGFLLDLVDEMWNHK